MKVRPPFLQSSSLLRWINDFSSTLRQNDFDRASRVWSGPEIVAALANMGISPATLPTLQVSLDRGSNEAISCKDAQIKRRGNCTLILYKTNGQRAVLNAYTHLFYCPPEMLK